MKNAGKIKSDYPQLRRTGDLAELIGVIWGDGYIGKFPRTESLRIVSNSNNLGFIERYSDLIENVFDKKPAVAHRRSSGAVDITIYENHISKRLGVPSGSKKDKNMRVPRWVSANRQYIIRYLRGLYEAEGTFSFHKKTYTHKFIFSNRNESILSTVERLLKKLGFHPHRSKDKIQISKKWEVEKVRKLLHFREYNNAG